MVNWDGLGMGVLDGVVIVEGKGQFGMNLGRHIVTNGAFATRSSQITLRTCFLSSSLMLKLETVEFRRLSSSFGR